MFMRSFNKKGKENVVVDTLSWKYEYEGSIFSLSFIVPDWLQDVHQEWLQDPKISHMIQQFQSNSPVSSGYSWHNDELHYKGRLYLSKQSQLKSTVLSELHATPTTRHSWFTKTYDRVKCSCWPKSLLWDQHGILHFHSSTSVLLCYGSSRRQWWGS